MVINIKRNKGDAGDRQAFMRAGAPMLVTRFPLARASRVECQVVEALRAAPDGAPRLDAAMRAASRFGTDHDRGARWHRRARSWLKRDRALAFIRERGRVSTEALCALGLSRQYISALCGEGVLIRVHQGYYEAPRISAAGATGGLP